MEKSVVALVPLSTYDQPAVDEAVRLGIRLLGGIGRLVRPEERILLKPNLLTRAQPQKAATTHPAVFAAVAKLLREEGYAHLQYGDSPGSPTTTPEKAAETCGIAAPARQYGVAEADFANGSLVPFPKGDVAKSFYLCTGAQEAEAIINICKMKTHALERITGAIKNIYGCVCGVNKATGHTTYPNEHIFADMLCDLHRCLPMRLHIMDGVVAMEGNGPASGTPTAMNVLLFSADPVALDSVFAALVHLDPASVPTCVSGERAGLGIMNLEQIEVLTPEGAMAPHEAQARWGNPRFDVFRGQLKTGRLFKIMSLFPFLENRPRVDKAKCIACGVCEEACPVEGKAVHSGSGKKAVYDYRKCIRCYCCQEMCPAKAIELYRHPIVKLLSGK